MPLQVPGPGGSPPVPGGTTSVELLARARGGDRGAVDRLFERLAPDLRRWARGRLPRWARGSADTGDVVQEAMTRVFRRIEHFEPQRQQALRAYLRRAVMNRIRDEIRSSRRRGAEVDVEDVDLTVPASLFDHLVDREREVRHLRAGCHRHRQADSRGGPLGDPQSAPPAR